MTGTRKKSKRRDARGKMRILVLGPLKKGEGQPRAWGQQARWPTSFKSDATGRQRERFVTKAAQMEEKEGARKEGRQSLLLWLEYLVGGGGGESSRLNGRLNTRASGPQKRMVVYASSARPNSII